MSVPITKALEIAQNKIKEIHTVRDWADEMEYKSANYFSRSFRNYFGKRPKSKLIEIKLHRFFELIENQPEMSCFEIAGELGLKDEVNLNKFIMRHTSKSPTKWKNR